MIDLKEIKLNILDRVYALAVDKLLLALGLVKEHRESQSNFTGR